MAAYQSADPNPNFISLDTAIQPLHSALYDEAADLRIFARHVLHARIDHPAGPVDLYTTHLASGSDYGRNDCNSATELVPGFSVEVPCPQGCDAQGTVRGKLFVEAYSSRVDALSSLAYAQEALGLTR